MREEVNICASHHILVTNHNYWSPTR